MKYTLNKKNVTLLDEKRILLQCNQCGTRWSPNIQEGGRLPRGYWKCPNGCNHTPRQFKHPKAVRNYLAKRTREYRAKHHLKGST